MGLINAIETIIGTIKFKRGLKENLPALKYGEAAYTYDENEMYIGGKDGDDVVNKKITRNSEVAANTEAINNLTESVASNTASLNAMTNNINNLETNKETKKIMETIWSGNTTTLGELTVDKDMNDYDDFFVMTGSGNLNIVSYMPFTSIGVVDANKFVRVLCANGTITFVQRVDTNTIKLMQTTQPLRKIIGIKEIEVE